VNTSPIILCVDDEANALFTRQAILQLNGYRVLTALTAEEGFRLFDASEVALVISDHFLTGTTGCELARWMKTLKPHVPVVMLSGAIELPDDAKHADVFLSKLEGPERMLNVVSELLQHAQEPIGHS
jgi:DNA-binding NtrC family response regulator